MRKKILFFHHASNSGGATISGLRFLMALPDNKFNVMVYCNTSPITTAAEMFEDAGFMVIRGNKSPVSFNHFSGSEKPILSIASIINCIEVLKDKKKIRKTILSNKPDIVVVNSFTLFWIGNLAKELGKETICFVRETYAKGFLGIRTKLIKHYLSIYFDKLVFISRYDFEQSKNLKSFKKVIYNTIKSKEYDNKSKLEEIKKLKLNKKDLNLLYVGGMSFLKGAHVILKTLAIIKRKDIKLIFVGYEWNGKRKKITDCKNWKQKMWFLLNLDYERKCIDIILKCDLSDKIKFYSNQKEISSFFLACDALVFPATSPHQARPVFEAGYARIPVIISDFPNIRESIDENSGFLFQKNDIKQLASIIDNLIIEDPNVRKKVSNNFQTTLKRHTKDIYAKEIYNLLINSK